MKYIRTSLLFISLISFHASLEAVVNSISESFRYKELQNDWVFNDNSTGSNKNTPYLTAVKGEDTEGYGWLRLTEAVGDQACSIYYSGEALDANQNLSVYCSFDFSIWGGNGADGICFFLFDGSVDYRGGAMGGSLGYAQKGENNANQAGLAGAYIGIGIDEYGNFSNSTKGKIGGSGHRTETINIVEGTDRTGVKYLYNDTEGSEVAKGGVVEDIIAVRGDEASGWEYLVGTYDENVPSLTRSFDFKDSKRRPNFTPDERKIVMIITATNQLTVYMKYGTGDLEPIFSADLSDQIRPETLRFGFAASTGGSNNNHEIRNVVVKSYTAAQWDRNASFGELSPGDLGDDNWGTPISWYGDTTPESSGSETIKFDNKTGLITAQNIVLGQERTVKSITVDSPFAYVFQNGTMSFESDTEGLFLDVTQINGQAPTGDGIDHSHYFKNNITTSATLNISINNDRPVYFEGQMETGGNLIRFTGDSDIYITGTNGIISGDGSIEKDGAGILYLTGSSLNSYTGDTLIRQGTIRVGKGTSSSNDSNSLGSLGQTTIEIKEGASLYLDADNQIHNSCDMHLSGGTFYLNGYDESGDTPSISSTSSD